MGTQRPAEEERELQDEALELLSVAVRLTDRLSERFDEGEIAKLGDYGERVLLCVLALAAARSRPLS